MKLLSIPSLLLIVIAVAIAYYTQKTPRYMPWHETRDWIRLLQIYDEQAAQQYAKCDSKIIATTFGATQVHACGDLSKAPVLFLHGAGSNALIYGDWLIPPLRESHYCIAVDFPCDVGRSAPKDMNPKNCPASQQDLAQWVQEILSQLSISKPTSIVGYSYGSLIAFIVALHKPHLVDKLVLIAPAAIFAPIEFAWIWRALVYGLTLTDHTHNWFMQFMSADPNFHMNKMEPHHKNLTDAIRLVSGTVLSVQADVFDDEVLREVIDAHPTLLLLGVNETVINATLAAERAKTAGAKTKLYKNSGHLMLMEDSRDVIAQDVASFIMHPEQH
jgi:pimeloyl-ACP methyl ester carboxylesterase